ncbi:MAG TPA: hypothetical protein VJV23_06595 [Candidatus Polarisedimenticolia bacterium]|nr:hypothetical protein [Candidatus Polarisedimenticolia bacterium]
MPRRADRSPAASIQAEPIEVLRLEFGRFPEISRLNPRFVERNERFKLTLDVRAARGQGSSPPALLGALESMLPSLSRHRCAGGGRLREIVLKRPRRGERSAEDAADIAHLLEHVIIDFQHFVAEMRICSGVTCGYESPRHRFDVFVETPGRPVSRLCVTLACELLNSLLKGAQPDPLCLKVVKLARAVHARGPQPLSAADGAAALGGDPQSAEALAVLRELRFVEEIELSLNFSRVPVFRLGSETAAAGEP